MKNMKRFCLFVSGMLLAFDFTGLFGTDLIVDSRPASRKSDNENIASDWQNVGKTLRDVINAK